MPSCAPWWREEGSQSAVQAHCSVDCMHSLAAMNVCTYDSQPSGRGYKDSIIASILLRCELWGADWFGSLKGAVRGMGWGWGIKFLSGVVEM